MRLYSLATRLFLVAGTWMVLVLPVAGFLIYSIYRSEAAESFDDRVRTLLLVVLADSVDKGGLEPGRPTNVGEPLFEVPNSGWYWQVQPVVKGAQGMRLASVSLGANTLPSPYAAGITADAGGVRWINGVGPDGQRARIAETLYTSGESGGGPVYSFIVAGPLDWLDVRVATFGSRLVLALAMAGLALIGATLLQVHFGLSPLASIERGLAAIRSGEATRLEGRFPAEIEPLQDELNALIRSNQEIIDRARTQVGNLAHALKTPLAVITNEARDDKGPLGTKVIEQSTLMRDQIAHYLERAQMAARVAVIGRVTEVAPVVEGLRRALQRIYGEKGVVIDVDCPDGARFQGERQDLEEMLGNLMDNACKWATSRVAVRVVAPGGEREMTGRNDGDRSAGAARRRLLIEIDDDGAGLDSSQRARLGKRGLRLDETRPGSGLGLSIVTDLATSYRGSLELAAAATGGLSARLELPAA
ncbi:MAG: ATP-binding protein [Hyphomicrobiaceae bacterium]